jgi:CrcB protein
MESADSALPVDPDVGPDDPGLRLRPRDTLVARWDILAVIALGGALGSLGRWGLSEALPHGSSAIAWSTMITNVVGAFALGALMVLVVDLSPASRYLRPFLAVGLLGGFTTFSTAMLDLRTLLAAEQPSRATGYLFLTLLLGLVAVWLGLVGMRVVTIRLLGSRAGAERRGEER